MALSQDQVRQILQQAGWSGNDLETMLAIGGRESGYNPAAHRTDNPGGNTGDYGLFQINYVNFPFLQKAIGITSMNDLLDPLTNAKAALALKNQAGNFSPWNAGPGGFNAAGSPTYGTSMQGGTVPTPALSNTTPTGTFKLPSDAVVYNIGGTWDVYATFDVGGAKISYKIPPNGAVDYSDKPPQVISQADWDAQNMVDGGDATELGAVTQSFGSFSAFFGSITTQVMGLNNPAKDDPEVKRVLATFAGRPDMSPAELQNMLEGTTWWKTRTTGQLEWNGLADGEKQKRRDDTAAQMADQWTQFTGEVVTAGDPRIQNYVEKVASGEMGMGAWTEAVVKPAALAHENSPYNRQISDEQKAEKQPGIDKENTAMRIRQTLGDWGVQWSEGTIQDWAGKIVNKDASDDDLMNTVKDQAQVAYAWKPRDMSTKDAAAPWLETYNRVLEKSGDITTPDVQKALTGTDGQATPVWQFEQDLKRSSAWLDTKNARDSLTTMAGSVGKIMGFS
jgi:hypothetical protein